MEIEVELTGRGSVALRFELEMTPTEALRVARRASRLVRSFPRMDEEAVRNTGGTFGFQPAAVGDVE